MTSPLAYLKIYMNQKLEQLVARYKAAFRAANGIDANVVYEHGWFTVTNNFDVRFRASELERAAIILENRAANHHAQACNCDC